MFRFNNQYYRHWSHEKPKQLDHYTELYVNEQKYAAIVLSFFDLLMKHGKRKN